MNTGRIKLVDILFKEENLTEPKMAKGKTNLTFKFLGTHIACLVIHQTQWVPLPMWILF